MSSRYEALTKEALIEILRRRDAQARGPARDSTGIDPDPAPDPDWVGFELLPELSCGPSPWRNLIIEGDNYDALRHLAATHAGAFHLIYIDAPYNTGRRDLVYNDRYFQPDDHGRHSSWIEFIRRRLVLARGLLRADGAIFVSIDDRELFNLGAVMNQVFGEACFVANCIWQKRYSRENRGSIGDVHEYLLVYSSDPDGFKKRRGRIPLSDAQARIYRNPDNPGETDPAKRWRGIPLTAQGYRPNQMYPIVAPNGTIHLPPDGRCWSMVESEFLKRERQGRIHWGKDGSARPSLIRYLSEVEGLVPWTWWTHEEVGHTDEARKEIQDIFGSQTAFDTPKPVRLLERVLQIGAPEKDALVLDFFAGSGTTAQAVLQMNRGDGGTRRFVLVANRELTAEEPDKNLARDVCAKRVRSVIGGYQSAKKGAVAGLSGDFAYVCARKIPLRRPGDGLSDEMAWNFLLLANDHPLLPIQLPLAVSIRNTRLVSYCANTETATLAQLRELVSAHQGQCVVAGRAPEAIEAALADFAGRINIVAVARCSAVGPRVAPIHPQCSPR